MAISMNIKTQHGIEVENAYIRIDEQSGDKTLINIRVRVYASQEKANEGYNWLEEKIYQFEPSVEEGSENFIKQGYEYLKTLLEFENAIDII